MENKCIILIKRLIKSLLRGAFILILTSFKVPVTYVTIKYKVKENMFIFQMT